HTGDQLVPAQLAAQLPQVGQGTVLARTARRQRHRAAVMAQGQTDQCRNGDTSLGRQTHGEVLCECSEVPGIPNTRLFESSVPFYPTKTLGFREKKWENLTLVNSHPATGVMRPHRGQNTRGA